MVKVCALLFTMLFGISAFAAKAELRVAEKSTVRVGDPIRLGVLLAGEIQVSELINKVYDLVVFEAFSGEGERVIKSQELALVLRERLSFLDLQLLSVKIPETFMIRAQRNFIYSKDLQRQVRLQASAFCPDCNIEFQDFNVPEIKSNQEILGMKLDTQSVRQSGTFLLPLKVETSQSPLNLWLSGRLAFYHEAPVATRLIQSGERLQASDFQIKKVNVTFNKDGAPAIEQLAGKVASRTITMGQPIYFGDLKKEQAAQRGQMVKIVLGTESFEVSVSGTAEESGAIGDTIKVKTADTKKIMSGVLIEKATVKVE